MNITTTTWSIDEMQRIWHLASKLHDGQKYGGPEEGQKVEYLTHIGSVAFEVLNAINHSENIDADLAMKCAVLHDSIEDTGFTRDAINDVFGAAVADGVLALSKNNDIKDGHEKMIDSLRRIKAQPKEVWAVKLADRIANLYEPPYYWTDEKKLKYIEEAKLIHAELKDGNAYLAKRLKQRIVDYHRFLSPEIK
jgi:(p)ppGpp synthase/HD superfamily hydrolase